jgi:hypothetical protein
MLCVDECPFVQRCAVVLETHSLDGEGVDGARDEHEGGQPHVVPLHPGPSPRKRPLATTTPTKSFLPFLLSAEDTQKLQ